MKNQFVNFQVVKALITMEQILDRYGLWPNLKRAGDRASGPCPIHGGQNDTQFRVSLSKNCWNCFGDCGKGGNTLDFVAAMEGIRVREAALQIVEWFGLDVDRFQTVKQLREGVVTAPINGNGGAALQTEPDKKPEPRVSENTENPPISIKLDLDGQHDYLNERGLEPATAREFGLGYCSRGLMQGHVAIPIRNTQGDLVAYAGRWPGNPPKGVAKYKLPKGFSKSIELFNLNRALKEPEDHPLVMVEGFFDCFALWQAGIHRCVAVMGCSLSDSQLQLIVESIPADSQIEILFDEDEAGRKGREAAKADLSQFYDVRVIELPEEGQQPTDLEEEPIRMLFE